MAGPTDAPSQMPATATNAKPQGGGLSALHMLLGGALLLGANYAFTHLMDESGLPVLLVTGEASGQVDRANATALMLYKASVGGMADSLLGDEDRGLLRLELLEVAGGNGGSGAFAWMQVHRRGYGAEALVPELAGRMRNLHQPRRLQTIFPERSRWRLASLAGAEGELPLIGEVSLLSAHVEMQVRADSLDSFTRLWGDLGYNSLGEEGVVRCDLLQDLEKPTVFLSRKVFRGNGALKAHEGSVHFAEWQRRVQPLLDAAPPSRSLFNTLHPASFFIPFRSQWTTV